jgi:hypothetical protein
MLAIYKTIGTVLLAGGASGQWLTYPTPGIPRLPDGKPNLSAPAPRLAGGRPDLSGIWAAECALYNGGGCFTRSLFFDLARDLKPDEVQMTPWASKVQAQREGRDHVDDPYGYCLPPGVPRIDFGGGPFKILQAPGVTAFLHETLVGMIFRQVFTDGRKQLVDPAPTWLGYSIGTWDLDTLVIDTRGFNDRSWLDARGHGHSEQMRVEERFHRRDYGHLDLTITIEDPKIFTRPVTVSVTEQLLPDTDVFEHICAEAEKDAARIANAPR